MYTRSSDFSQSINVTGEELDAILDSPVLKTEDFKDPIKITSIDLLFNNGLYFVRTRSEMGIEGIAVASDRATYLYPILNQLIIPYFIGKDARELESLIDGVYIYGSNYKLAGLALWCCISWVEASILDLLGKVSNKPIGSLLGEVINDEVSIYVASGNRGTTPEEEVDILARRVEQTGAKAIKFKIGGRMSRNADSIDGRSETLIHLTREYFGNEMVIHADGNGSYDPNVAIKYGQLLEEINAYFYEEPCPFDNLWETKEVAQALEIPIAFGEQETSMRRFKWIIENDAAQVIQPDLQYNGGFIRTTKVARMAKKAGKTVTLHISGGYSYVYMLHFASYTPNIGRFQEHKDGVNQTRELFNPSIEVRNGIIKIPTGAGLGMEFDSKILKKALKIV